jgi:hypothetical protein
MKFIVVKTITVTTTEVYEVEVASEADRYVIGQNEAISKTTEMKPTVSGNERRIDFKVLRKE